MITVVLIVSAAGLALLCDFLKAKNEQLQEALAELRVRKAEEALRVSAVQQRAAVVAAQLAAGVETKPVVSAPVPAAPPVLPRPATPKPAATNNYRPTGRSGSRSQDAAATIVRKPNPAPNSQRPQNASPAVPPARQPIAQPAQPKPAPMTDEMNSNEDLTDWLNRRATARAARVAQKTEPDASRPATRNTAPPTPALKPAGIEGTPEPAPKLAPIGVLLATAPAAAIEIDASLWESMTSGRPAPAWEPAHVAKPETQFELIRSAAANSPELVVPGGLFDQAFLARLLEIHKPFNGLVVSIGISENDGREPQSADLLRSTSSYIGNLLRKGDFGCQVAADEFLMICPGEQGAEAQRRLSHISEQLWDYQLRGVGAFSILFSWGGIDVRNEPLSDAIASATERMRQTKRCRKTVSMDSVNQRRKVV